MGDHGGPTASGGRPPAVGYDDRSVAPSRRVINDKADSLTLIVDDHTVHLMANIGDSVLSVNELRELPDDLTGGEKSPRDFAACPFATYGAPAPKPLVRDSAPIRVPGRPQMKYPPLVTDAIGTGCTSEHLRTREPLA
jgi:hypothetical protein